LTIYGKIIFIMASSRIAALPGCHVEKPDKPGARVTDFG